MSNATSLVALSAASLVSLYNGALDEYGAPNGFAPLGKVKRKADAIEAIEALCAAGSLAVSFDSGTATIIDASAPNEGGSSDELPGNASDELPGNASDEGDEGDEGDNASDEGDEGDNASDEGDEGDNASDEGGNADEGDYECDEVEAAPLYGDGKGKVRAWGFALGSDEWLAANPRGTAAREAYRKARRAAARSARKAKRAAQEAAAE